MPHANTLACFSQHLHTCKSWICCFIGSPLCFDRNTRGCVCLRPVCCNHQSHHSTGVHLWRFAAVLLWAYSCSDPRAWLSLGWLCRQPALWFDHGLQVCWCSHEDEACRIARQQTDAPTQQWSRETSKWHGQMRAKCKVLSVMEFKCSSYWWNTILPPCSHVQVLREALVMKCKCHGVSGSCSIRTCWKGLQDLREIAIDLKTKYLSATKVVHRPMGTRKQLVPKDIDIRPVRENELVYLQSSPDFCTKNEKQGSVGTQDRWGCLVMLLCLSLHEKEEGIWQQE